MSKLIEVITATDPAIRNRSLDTFCRRTSLDDLVTEVEALDRFRRDSDNLYERVRGLFFLYAIHRFHLPNKNGMGKTGLIPFTHYSDLLKRRFEEAIDGFLTTQAEDGPSDSISSALAAAYHGLGFQTLANQVRRSVRSVLGNQWMFRIGHPADHPLRVRPELLERPTTDALFAIARETTPVRMDFTHSGWSDIFFLGMDFPEGARVINTSIDLCVRQDGATNSPKPPVEAYFRVIDQPIIRLVSVDLEATAEISELPEIFDFARDYLGLLKAAVIASGIIPQGMEGTQQPLADLLSRVVKPDHGIEIVSRVNDIPKGSRLAVSTNLLACLITVCMRATNQTRSLTGGLDEEERRVVASRAILGEWLGGSGGGWQDSGGVWPGMKLIEGAKAEGADPEFGISTGRLLPNHRILNEDDVAEETLRTLEKSLVLVHGGMAQDVGPILEMVTEKYLLRSEDEWEGRQEATAILDEIMGLLKKGEVDQIGKATQRNFEGPIQTIIPWATNLYTETLISKVEAEFSKDFHGFWMLGGMAGGGMGFIFDPAVKPKAQRRIQEIMSEAKGHFEKAMPFAMEPVVYDFSINERGTQADLLTDEDALMPPGYYMLTVPTQLRLEPRSLSAFRRAELDCFSQACRTDPRLVDMVPAIFDRVLPNRESEDGTGQTLDALLQDHGFDHTQHEQIRADLRSGRIGLAQNRLPTDSRIEDVDPDEIMDATTDLPEKYRAVGMEALAAGTVAVVTLAAGAGSRWTKGAGVVKALSPFCKLSGKHRSFIEVHLAKSRRSGHLCGVAPPHVITTSYLTHDPISTFLKTESNYGYDAPLFLSPGRNVGQRMIPMIRDLRFAWEEMPQQLLDEQAQKVLESLRSALSDWAMQMGEANDYLDNLPLQCLHPVGHWYEVPNLLRNGTLAQLCEDHPSLKYLMVHNIDTLGAHLDPALLGYHVEEGATLSFEVIGRRIEDRGGGLARINGRNRLIEGLALPREEIEFDLSYYNTLTSWIDVDRLLNAFSLTKDDLANTEKVTDAVRSFAAKLPTYVTLKEVKKRWGHGQEDIFPVTQFEKLWGDMTALPEVDCRFVVVPRDRGQQLKEPAQLDGWLRDGSANYLESICQWE